MSTATVTDVRARPVVPALWVMVAVVVGLEVAYPLVHGSARDRLTVATVVVFAVTSWAHALVSRGPVYAGALLAVGTLGFGAEVLGVHTGVPFGDYHYTGGLGLSVAGVPLVVGAAWLMMAHPAQVVAATLSRRRVLRVVVATVALAGWDVFLDPQMVDAGHWRWLGDSWHLRGIDDVPLSNFGGWLLVALVVALVLTAAARSPALLRAGDGPALALWLWVWLSSAFANLVFFDRPAVAAWGFVAMGVVGVPLVVRLRR